MVIWVILKTAASFPRAYANTKWELLKTNWVEYDKLAIFAEVNQGKSQRIEKTTKWKIVRNPKSGERDAILTNFKYSQDSQKYRTEIRFQPKPPNLLKSLSKIKLNYFCVKFHKIGNFWFKLSILRIPKTTKKTRDVRPNIKWEINRKNQEIPQNSNNILHAWFYLQKTQIKMAVVSPV